MPTFYRPNHIFTLKTRILIREDFPNTVFRFLKAFLSRLRTPLPCQRPITVLGLRNFMVARYKYSTSISSMSNVKTYVI
jgi:hypothetical protein